MQSDDFALYNLWGDMMKRAGWSLGAPLMGSRDQPDNACLNYWLRDGQSLLTDELEISTCSVNIHLGLHFLPPGYKFLYEGIMETIKIHWPDQYPVDIPFHFPSWEEAPKG